MQKAKSKGKKDKMNTALVQRVIRDFIKAG